MALSLQESVQYEVTQNKVGASPYWMNCPSRQKLFVTYLPQLVKDQRGPGVCETLRIAECLLGGKDLS